MSWLDKAKCKHMDTSLFEPVNVGRGGNGRQSKVRPEAAAACAACPVTEQCLDDADDSRDHSDASLVRAGMTGYQRRHRLRRLGRVVRQPIAHATERGYQQHRRAGETPCMACTAAWRFAQQQRRSS